MKRLHFGKKPADNKPPQPTPDKSGLPQVKKIYSKRLMILGTSGASFVLGVVLFIIYFLNESMAVGAPAIFLMLGGFFVFKYYWEKTDDVVTEYIGKQTKGQVNSLCLYPDRIVFEDVASPGGFPWDCLNDKKKYFVNIWDESLKRLVPFILPDQQYYDPGVFAERVLELPAHRKIFTRKPSLFQKLKTGLLVAAIGIIWLLIITTSGG